VEEAEERRLHEEAERAMAAAAALEQKRAEEEAAQQAAEVARAAEARREEERREERAQASALLPDEPEAGPGVTTVVVRMPEGNRVSRRFPRETELRLVRRWVEVSSPPERPMQSFELVSTYPRYVASDANASVTLDEAGMHPQATLFVRQMNDDDEQ